MKKNTSNKRPSTKKLMDVSVDKSNLSYESIEQDESGRIFLHKSKTVNSGCDYGEEDEYFDMSAKEYEQ